MASMADDKKGPDLRNHPRVDLFTRVKVVDKETKAVQEVLAGNVSKGGIFLRSNRPLPRGKKVALEFELDGGQVQIDDAEIVWNKPFEPISVDGALPGMGIRFESARQDSLERIGRFIDEALTSSMLPEKAPPPAMAEIAVAPVPLEVETKAAPTAEAQAVDVVPTKPITASMKVKLKGTPPPPPADADQEVPMAQFTTPPPPGKRAMLFVIFVVAVAAVTFLLLLLLKPFDRKSAPEEASPPPAVAAENHAGERAPATPTPAAVAEPKPVEKPVEKTPAVAEMPAEKTPAVVEKPVEKSPPPAEKPAETPAAAAPDEVFPPVFNHTEKGWLMELAFAGDAKVQHFTLKSPPRLAIDIPGARYPHRQRTIEAPAPIVQRVRVGVEPGKVRLVLDFTGEKIPAFSLQRSEKGLSVVFPE